MGCSGCLVGTNEDGTPKGCRNNGGCSSGSCNKLNTYDWLTRMDLPDTNEFGFVEVSFKNGSRKSFFQYTPHSHAVTGDMVVVESGAGMDVGEISLSGDLVRLQMKKKKVTEASVQHKIVRRANERDIERLREARSREQKTMVKARVIARNLGLEMKIGDVEYQGDKRKATFYYTADGRVDFRALIRELAREFRVKIEMRQIGARQESARIGGIGSCGRELCCSTWLTDFQSVSTAAARYQNLAINQTKLSGQCGRLKCCLNYELDTYMDALEAFPKGVDKLFTEAGKASLVKTDIFKKTMYFAYDTEFGPKGKFYPLSLERVKAIHAMNKNGEKPEELVDEIGKYGVVGEQQQQPAPSVEFGDDEGLTGVIELPPEVRRRKKRNKNRKGQQGKPRSASSNKNQKGGNQRRSNTPKPQHPNQKGETGKRPPAHKKSNNNQKSGQRNNQSNQKKNSPGKQKPNPASNKNRNQNRRNNRNNKPQSDQGNDNKK
ncbi:MAG: regulatory iron-sulfur-containing complex subunit RicT [Bacteroidota bacterium]